MTEVKNFIKEQLRIHLLKERIEEDIKQKFDLNSILSDGKIMLDVLSNLNDNDKKIFLSLIDRYKKILSERVKISSKTYSSKKYQTIDANLKTQQAELRKKIETILQSY